MTVSILKTKLHLPTLPPKFVRRENLCQKLTEGLESGRELTLVSAPAGFGKTTCISEWLNSIKIPAAWLSLDSSDDDPGRFFTYLIAAFRTIDPDIGREIEAIIQSGQVPPSEIISAEIINDILEINHRFLLVLDDFHIIQDNEILIFFENLVVKQPKQLHLVLLTREDPSLPLARLRASNKLTEIRAKDLRFSESEIRIFLDNVMTLSLSGNDIAVLEEKTEGWVVGLQLAGLLIKEKSDPSTFISGLSGGHYYFLSYLTEQVLDQQSEEIQEFLLQTAILDRFNVDLCNAVSKRADTAGLIERIFNANLFLVPLDDEHQWYRYHHLFADLLRGLGQRTHPKQIPELHQRASNWYAQAGMVNEAVQHALLGADYQTAVRLIEEHALEMVMHGYAKTVNSWVQAIPDEWRMQSPKTHLAFAWMHLLRGAYDHVSPYLQALQDVFSTLDWNQEEKRSLKAEWLVMRSLLLTMEGRVDESLKLVKEALEIVPQKDERVRSMVFFGLACFYQTRDDYNQVEDAYQKAIQYGRVSGNYITEMLSISGLAQLAFEHGHLQTAYEIVKPVCDRLEKQPSLPPISTVVFGILGEVNYQWCKLKKARYYFEHAHQLSALGGFNSGMINTKVLISRVALLGNELEIAGSKIDEANSLMPVEIPEYVRQEVISQRVRVYLSQGNLEAAQSTLNRQGFTFEPKFSYPALTSDQGISYSMGLLYNSSLHVLLYQARNGKDLSALEAGIELASKILEGAVRTPPILTRLESLLLRAQMYARLGNVSAAEKDYLKALNLGEQSRFIGIILEQENQVAETLSVLAMTDFVDAEIKAYIEQILSASNKLQKITTSKDVVEQKDNIEVKPLIDPLTARELEVLYLIGDGLTYKEIADRLFISVNTVRYHIKAIYSKLNTKNRTQALEKARRLKIF